MRAKVPMTQDLEVSIEHGEHGNVVRLRGRLNIDSSPALRNQLLAALQVQSAQPVSVDFSEVSYVDSSGIATMIEALGVARMRGRTLCLQGLQGRILNLFQVIGVSALFEKNGCGSTPSVSQIFYGKYS